MGSYYPFGLKHKGYNNIINGTDHPYGFGGKEEQDELGLSWIDITARNYDASLGRWMNIDPLADQMYTWSPYNYSYNNPIFYLDDDGNSPISIFVKMAAKKGLKIAAKNFVKDQIKKKLKQYSTKAWGKQLLGDAIDFVDHATKTQWWEWVIEVIPVVGDGYGAAKLGEQGYKLWKGLEKFEKVAELGTKAASNAWKKVGRISDIKISGKSGELLNKYTTKFNNQGRGLNMNDLGGAVKEKFGLSSNGQHLFEVNNSLKGMETQMKSLMSDIADGKFKKGDALDGAVDLLNQVRKQHQKIRKALDDADNVVNGLGKI